MQRRFIYTTREDIEPLLDAYIGERAEDKTFFPVFVGFLIAIHIHCELGSPAYEATKQMIVHYRNLILSPVVAPAQKFAKFVDDMIGDK